jgi:hypothetical protein
MLHDTFLGNGKRNRTETTTKTTKQNSQTSLQYTQTNPHTPSIQTDKTAKHIYPKKMKH